MTPITPGPQHPPLTAEAAAAAVVPILTQCFDRNLPRQRRRQVDAHQIHVLMQQHVVDPVGVEWDVHLFSQFLRLLLRAAPQRFDGEALVLQQRDDDPGGEAGAEHADPWKHDSAFLLRPLRCVFILTAPTGAELPLLRGWTRPSTCSQTAAAPHFPIE